MINLHWRTKGSWSVVGACFAAALRKRMPVAFVNAPGEPTADGLPPSDDAITLNFGDWRLSPTLPGRKVVSYIPWETSRIPRPIRWKMRKLDDIWVPSEWQRQLFIANGIPAEKLAVVPLGFDPEIFHPEATVPGEAGAPFRFLFVGKWEERKALPELLQAFCTEFDPNEAVELVLHAHNPFIDGFDQEERLRKELRKLNAIGRRIRCSREVPVGDLGRMYHEADAFVLPTRAEGWGLPLLEAMACGLPCIATNYSGLTEFAHDDNALLVETDGFIRVRDDFFFNRWLNWGRWARPSVPDLRKWMRWVVQHRAEARELGRCAAAEVAGKWTWDHAAKIAVKRIAELG